MVSHHLHRWTPEILFQCSCWLLEGPLRCCYNHHRDPTCFVITGLLLDQMSSTSAVGIPPFFFTLSSRGLPSSSLAASSKASRGVPSPLPLWTKPPEGLHLCCCWHPAWHAEELCFLNCHLVPARPPERSRHVFCCCGPSAQPPECSQHLHQFLAWQQRVFASGGGLLPSLLRCQNTGGSRSPLLALSSHLLATNFALK